jgi:hypothetical protein
MSEDKKTFTVNDRRHFTAEGEIRDSEPAAPSPASAPPPASPVAAAPPPSPPADQATDEAASVPGNEAPPYPSDFPSLVLSLGTQASLLLLGSPEEPPDLAGGRSLITLLEVLHEKTEGHRTEQEDRLLEGLLYELRMAYVARSKAAGS